MVDDDSNKKETKGEVLSSAWPPLHTQILVGMFAAFFVARFPSLESIDEVATVETFTARVFPEYLSIEDLAYARFAAMGLVLGVTIYSVFLQKG